MVMQEMPTPRDTFVLIRGEYDKHGEKVTPGVPASLPPLPDGTSNNRLGFARWLVDPANPLTARVTVNRYWQMLFGTGLVKTVEDFGSQGEWPSHPELLDWLATEFVRQRLGRQSDPANDRHQRHLSPIVEGDARIAAPRSGQSPARARPALPAVRRDDPRSGAVRQRPARRETRRAAR